MDALYANIVIDPEIINPFGLPNLLSAQKMFSDINLVYFDTSAPKILYIAKAIG